MWMTLNRTYMLPITDKDRQQEMNLIMTRATNNDFLTEVIPRLRAKIRKTLTKPKTNG